MLPKKTFKNNLFLLRVVSKEEGGPRFGFSISKKVAKSAVVRNKMRRLGYRLIKDYISRIDSSLLVSITFISIPKDSEVAVKNLEQILKESKIIK